MSKKKEQENTTAADDLFIKTVSQAAKTPEKGDATPAKPSTEAPTSQALDAAQQALEEANTKYLRLYAEFENFRRRETKEKLALIATASQGMLEKLLPVVDDFERALKALKEDTTQRPTILEGIQLIYDKLFRLLQQEGVQPMELVPGANFDPELHEAVTQTHTEDPAMKGKVIDTISKGYLLKDKVLRFAKVVIGA